MTSMKRRRPIGAKRVGDEEDDVLYPRLAYALQPALIFVQLIRLFCIADIADIARSFV